MTDTVTISKELYDELLADSRFLGILEANGVDNWDWYDDARQQFIDEYSEDE